MDRLNRLGSLRIYRLMRLIVYNPSVLLVF